MVYIVYLALFWTSDKTLPAASSRWTEWIDVDDMRSRGRTTLASGPSCAAWAALWMFQLPRTMIRRDTPGNASHQLPSALCTKAVITFAATFAKPKIFELDIGIGIIALALLRCLGLPQCEVAAIFSMTVIGHRSWSCGGARSCSSQRLPTAAFARGAVTSLSGYTLD